MTNQTETMSAEEAADYLKASVRTVQELAMDGKLKGAKIGKGWVFFRRDVVAYLEGRIYGALPGGIPLNMNGEWPRNVGPV